MAKYRTPYMREYRQFKAEQMTSLKKALKEGRFDLAKIILEGKPLISVAEKSRKGSKKRGR